MKAIRRFPNSPELVAGAAILALFALIALTAPLIFPRDPLSIAGPAMLSPFQDWSLPLGTDRLMITRSNVFSTFVSGVPEVRIRVTSCPASRNKAV